MTHVAALLAVRNRCEITRACLSTLVSFSSGSIALSIIVVDDGSTDGTAQMIQSEFPSVTLLNGDGSLYWVGAMKMAEGAARMLDPDYYLWVNDDADLDQDALDRLLATGREDAVACGAFKDARTGLTTYSGARRPTGRLVPFTLTRVDPHPSVPTPVDTFNGNFVLVPRAVMTALDGLDDRFTHHWGDFDFGLRASRDGFRVLLAPGHVGRTARNPASGSFRDSSWTRRARLQDLGSPRGYPFGEKFRYLRRHGTLLWPVQLAAVQMSYILRILTRRPISE